MPNIMNIVEHVCAGVAIFVFVFEFTFVFVDGLMPYTSYSLRHLITNMMPQSCYPPLCKFFIRMTNDYNYKDTTLTIKEIYG